MIKGIIEDYNQKAQTFGVFSAGVKSYFYLRKYLVTIFGNTLKNGYLLEFEIAPTTKIIDKKTYHQVENITKIVMPPKKVLFDVNKLLGDMLVFLKGINNFLVIDFECTMAGFKQKKFIAEIIQVGYLLTDSNGVTLKQDNMYILPKSKIVGNERIFKFISTTKDEYYGNARDYEKFYNDLKEIMETYHPKIITWGRNDKININYSYKINNVEPVTNDFDFINLLQLHKNAYGLKDDIGLYKAYCMYYENEEVQDHNAFNDAYKTKEVLFSFIKRLEDNKR
ncbi:MAG: hypothetical protein LBV51_04930 [Acholeplasmatales bacterium]|jgi:sporulation inhibitor KapD|nr:hypothetical protein [Acholeplasmatales bacterium]